MLAVLLDIVCKVTVVCKHSNVLNSLECCWISFIKLCPVIVPAQACYIHVLHWPVGSPRRVAVKRRCEFDEGSETTVANFLSVSSCSFLHRFWVDSTGSSPLFRKQKGARSILLSTSLHDLPLF